MKIAFKFGALAMIACAMGWMGNMGSLRAAEEPKVPEWVPVFPDVKPMLAENKSDAKGTSVIWYFNTPKSPAEVKAFYESGFEKAGFKKADFKAQQIDDKEDGVTQENLKGGDEKRSWFISARQEKNGKETQVSLVYMTKN